jgi:hypothetical protein
MTTVAHITITGIAEIRAKLTPQVFRATLVDALRTALAPVASSASALAPRKTGKLASTIRAAVSTRGGTISAAIVTGVRYGHLVEYGHREVVGGRARRAGLFGNRTGRVIGQVPPHPFAGPAFTAQQGTVSQTIERRLASAIAGHE